MNSMAQNGHVTSDDVIGFLSNLKTKIGKSYDDKIKKVKGQEDAEMLESSCYEEQHVLDLVISMIKDNSSG